MWDSMAEADKDAEFLPRTSTQRMHHLFKFFTMLDRVEDAVAPDRVPVLPEDRTGLVLPGGGLPSGPWFSPSATWSSPEACGVGLDTWCVVDVDPERFEVMVDRGARRIPRRREPHEQRGRHGAARPLARWPAGALPGSAADPSVDFYAGALPDRITIYRRAICAIVQQRAEVVEQVRRTVIHEVGHHFGIGDARLRDLAGERRPSRRSDRRLRVVLDAAPHLLAPDARRPAGPRGAAPCRCRR